MSICAAASSQRPVVDSCSWDRPGRDPFVGDVVAAVDRYQDIPASIRGRLKARMAERSYNEFVAIERDAIVGKHSYEPAIRDMHFGNGRICKTVTRAKWTAEMRERGFVYCESGFCILVPTVCRNVSRITRIESTRGTARSAGTPEFDNRHSESLTYGPASHPETATQDLFGDRDDAIIDTGGADGAGQTATFTVVSRGAGSSDASGLIGNRSTGIMSSQPPFGSPFAGGTSPPPLSPVPEAPAWLMAATGALLMSVLARRRRRS